DCCAAAHTGCQARGVARACMASEPDTGRINPLQLLMKAFQTWSRSSPRQPGSAFQDACWNFPESPRGGVSRIDSSAGTVKGCSAILGAAAPGSPAPGTPVSVGTVLHAARMASKPLENRILFIKDRKSVV